MTLPAQHFQYWIVQNVTLSERLRDSRIWIRPSTGVRFTQRFREKSALQKFEWWMGPGACEITVL